MTTAVFFFALCVPLITACFMQHGSNTNREIWWLFDDLRWNAEFSLAEDAAMAENRLNYLRHYRRN